MACSWDWAIFVFVERRAASSPEVQGLVRQVLEATKEAGVLSGIAVGNPCRGEQYLALGYSLVMVSNDATLFGRAAAELVRASREMGG